MIRAGESLQQYDEVETVIREQTQWPAPVIIRVPLRQCYLHGGALAAFAVNGRDALNQLRQKEFELVLTDLKMAKMDGIQKEGSHLHS